MHVLFAGASGVVGRRTVPVLVARGHRVTALTRRPEALPGLRRLGAEPVIGDVYDRTRLIALARRASPDAVLHQLTDLAAVDLTANARLRTVGTRNLADAAHAVGVERFVAQSIAWAYVDGAHPADEDEPLDVSAPDPRGTTVRAVHALETAVRGFGQGVVLRYGMLYGPGTWFEPNGLRAAEARNGNLVAGQEITSFLHVDDAAVAAVCALDWPAGTLNICDREPAPAAMWVPIFAASLGAPPPAVSTTPRRPWARGANAERATRLGWQPLYPSWRTGFSRLRDYP